MADGEKEELQGPGGPARAESLLQSQTALLAAQAVQVALGVLLTITLVRSLSPAAFGSFIFVSAWMVMAARVVDAGVGPALVRELVARRSRLWHLVFSVRTGLAVLFAVATPMVFIANADLALAPRTRFVVGAVTGVALFALPLRSWHSLFAALRRNRLSAWISSGAQSLHVALSLGFVLWFGVKALPWVIVALALREFINSAGAWMTARRKGWKVPVDRGEAPQHRERSSLLYLSLATVSTALYFHVDVFMVEAVHGPEEVAVYGIAVRVLAPLLTAVHLLTTPVLPFLARAVDNAARKRVFHHALWLVGLLVLPVSLALFRSEGIVDLLTGREGDPGGKVLIAMAPVPFFVVGGAIASAALIAMHRHRTWFALAFGGLLLNLILNALWIPDLGALGAARATLCTELAVSLAAVVAVGAALQGSSRVSVAVELPGRAAVLGVLFVVLAAVIFAEGHTVLGSLFVFALAGISSLWLTRSRFAAALRRRIEAEAIESAET